MYHLYIIHIHTNIVMKGHKVTPPTNRTQYESNGKDPRFVNVMFNGPQKHSANLCDQCQCVKNFE